MLTFKPRKAKKNETAIYLAEYIQILFAFWIDCVHKKYCTFIIWIQELRALTVIDEWSFQIPGTAEQARLKIRHYFNELRETLNRQEVVALTTVDTHIREKLCMLRQQQEDMAILLSQVSAVCHQCESTLQQVNIFKFLNKSVLTGNT